MSDKLSVEARAASCVRTGEKAIQMAEESRREAEVARRASSTIRVLALVAGVDTPFRTAVSRSRTAIMAIRDSTRGLAGGIAPLGAFACSRSSDKHAFSGL